MNAGLKWYKRVGKSVPISDCQVRQVRKNDKHAKRNWPFFFTKAGALADQLELATRRGTLSARPLAQSVAEDWLKEALAVCTDTRAHSFLPDYQAWSVLFFPNSFVRRNDARQQVLKRLPLQPLPLCGPRRAPALLQPKKERRNDETKRSNETMKHMKQYA